MLKYKIWNAIGFFINGLGVGITTKTYWVGVITVMIGGVIIAISNYFAGARDIKEIYKVGL